VCRAQFVELKQLDQRMAEREQAYVSYANMNAFDISNMKKDHQTLRATTPGYTQMEQAIKNTARSVSSHFDLQQGALEKKLEARMDEMAGVIEKKWAALEGHRQRLKKLEALMGNTDALQRDGVTLEGLWAIREMTGLHNRMDTLETMISGQVGINRRLNDVEKKVFGESDEEEVEIEADDESPPRYPSLAGVSEAGPSETMTTFGPMTARELATVRVMVREYLAVSRSRQ
jgi:DNA repair exonuclease SbcCD ATPase subunit